MAVRDALQFLLPFNVGGYLVNSTVNVVGGSQFYIFNATPNMASAATASDAPSAGSGRVEVHFRPPGREGPAADVIMRVGDTDFHCHSQVLAAGSKVLATSTSLSGPSPAAAGEVSKQYPPCLAHRECKTSLVHLKL